MLSLMQVQTRYRESPPLGGGGFTIIELMIVVAVISVLMVISIPIYQSYTARAQISEGMYLTAFIKQRISEVMTFQGSIPDTGPTPANLALGLPVPSSINGEYVSAVSVLSNPSCADPTSCYPAHGTIVVEYKVASAHNNKKHAIQPYFLTGSIKWDCASDADPAKNPAAALHVPIQFRPPVCRPF